MRRLSLKEMKCLPQDHSATIPMYEPKSGGMEIKEKELDSSYDSYQSQWYEQYLQPCVVELLGSALFIFIGCLSVIEDAEGLGRLQPCTGTGLALSLTLPFWGNISGGHFNPAVSLAVMLIGGLNYMMLIPYCISQLCGGIIGAALAKVVSSEGRFLNASGAAFTAIRGDDQLGSAVVAEAIMTLFLLLTVCMAAVNEKTKSPLAPFCIGFTVTVDILAGGAISGACMNPARAFGPAVMSNHWRYQWVYWLGPLAASLIAGILIRTLIGDQKIRLFLKHL
ncbi:LOW QUALITY PROTEIN: aquaporin-8 [Dromiciops gliroides]|uniref:LOW QUALITY PROTEIN: aquaporin-8 n=1 Tax=Dromiciops gliroides TaxID=33562 RepID=UPI001CC433A1|nr:LOW QUALITY PROTEIN: aquaporin-8 [Dromiciops gliroides]